MEDEPTTKMADETTQMAGESTKVADESTKMADGSTKMADELTCGECEEEAAGSSFNGRPDDLPPNMMQGTNGERLLKWKIDYAGGHQAQCRDLQCLFRVDNGGSRVIKKGELRIGRRILMENGFGSSGDPHMMMQWYHARCIFHQFLRARKTTRIIESEADMEGFQNIELEDQGLVTRMINGSEDVRKAAQNQSSNTPEKVAKEPGERGRPGGRKRAFHDVEIEVGQRVWAHYRSGTERVKSKKPELAAIRSEEMRIDGTILIQFESNNTKKTREELYNNPRRKRMRGWNRYARTFDGPKQWISRDWVEWNKPVPRLCGCNKQVPDHDCACGMTCSGMAMAGLVYGPDVENVTSREEQADALETLRKRLKESEARNLKETEAQKKKGPSKTVAADDN